jgi:type II secretory pathway pseudopilin PulG
MNKNLRAFGLVSILVIVLMVGALSGMVLMGITSHRNALLTTRTRVQFMQYEFALKAYCHEYGEMPPFIGQEEVFWLDRDGNSELLIMALSGRNPNGSQLSAQDRDYLNPLGKRFYTFTNSDFFRRADESLDRSQLADAFNNRSICIVVESVLDNDTTIPKSILPQVVQKQIVNDSLDAQIVIFSIDERDKAAVTSLPKK